MAIVINGQTGIDAGHLPISNAGNTEVEGTFTGADATVNSITANSVMTQGQNVSPFSGFKNYIINGNFDVWQRGASQTSNGYGSDDRWYNGSNVSTKTHTIVACTDTERALFNASYFSRTVVTSVVGISNYVNKEQKIEDVTKLAGKTVTLSFWAKADSNKNIAIDFYQYFGTGGTPSSAVGNIGLQTVALTPIWQKKYITITFPSIVGKTLGTDGIHTSYTSLEFWFDAGSSFSKIIGQQSGTFDIAQVQLEEGSVATPFENRPYGLELSLCQRYYRTMYINRFSAVMYSPNGDTRMNPIPIGSMRTAPSVVPSSFTHHSISFGHSGQQVNSPTVTWVTSVDSFMDMHLLRFMQCGYYSGYTDDVVSVGAHCDTTFCFSAEL